MTDNSEGLAAELANNAVEYEDAAYVEGVRDLARMIEQSGTANWKAVVGVLNDCAGMIELRTRERDALTTQAETPRACCEAERERCAKIADDEAEAIGDADNEAGDYWIASHIARRIRGDAK